LKILIIGSGGREHALSWACNRSSLHPSITCTPGNGGTARFGRNVDISAEDVSQLEDFIRAERFDLTIIGPEAPAVGGLADRLIARGFRVFGPSAGAARIEGSKAFAKQLMIDVGIPTAAYETFTDVIKAKDYIRSQGAPIVVKASGLAAGKGAVVCLTVDQALAAVSAMLENGEFGEAGGTVVVEEYLEGVEVSMTAIADGTDFLLLPPSRDHKRVFDHDRGPNTGGMGACSPLSDIPDHLYRTFAEDILPKIQKRLDELGSPFRGVIYPGLMVKDNKFKVLEFNARFGDPETQALLPLLNKDLLEIMAEVAEGNLSGWRKSHNIEPCEWRKITKPLHSVTVVAASKGYPGSIQKGFEITGIPVEEDNRVVFHAGTKAKGNEVVTSGGRVLAVTGLGDTSLAATETAYEGIGQIRFEGMHYRRDIGRSER